MNKATRKVSAILLITALVGLMLPSAAGAQEVDAARRVSATELDVDTKPANLGDSVRIRTSRTSAIIVGDTAWVTVSLRGLKAVDNLRFTATVGRGGSVSYPANTVDHSGPNNGYDLDVKETDYVAFKVTIPDGVEARRARLKLSATWTEGDRSFSGDTSLAIPLVRFDGAPYTLLTETVALEEADNGWVTLSFAGLAPRVEQLEVSIASPLDLDLYYPLDTFTSLLGDSLLEDGETDVAKFRINESLWGQSLDLEVTVSYLVAGVAETATHKLSVTL